MGVSLRSYGKLSAEPVELLPGGDEEMHENYEKYVEAWCLPGFEKHALEGLVEGAWYEISEPGPVASLSYGGYGLFREHLCRAALGVEILSVWTKPERYVDAPYYDLLNFADNEGLLGPASCTRIANAFRHHPLPVLFEDPMGLSDRYAAIRDVFYHAADGGAVNFT